MSQILQRLHAVPALLLLLSACARPPSPIRTTGVDQLHRYSLPNGLEVYCLENHESPLVTLDMWIRTGSADEPAELAGISHFLEHMMFKGTPRLGVGEYDRRIEELGGYLNASTSSDYTHYYLTVPSDRMDEALEDMADVLLNSLVDPDETEKERLVILEEIRQKQDSPVGFLYDEITRRIYDDGPYVGTVIGSPETVSAMTADQLREHYHRHYAPQNMALVVVGDFHAVDLQINLQNLYGGFDREYRPWREDPPRTRYAGGGGHEWEREWQQTWFFLTFEGEAAATIEQAAAAEILENLLVGGRSSRLVNSLREKQGLVSSISGFGPSGRHRSFWAVYGTCEPGALDRVRMAILKEIKTLAESGPSDEEFARVKRRIIADHLYQTETNAGKAAVTGYSHVLFGEGGLLTRYPEVVESVGPEEVSRILRSLTPPRSAFWVARPADSRDSARAD